MLPHTLTIFANWSQQYKSDRNQTDGSWWQSIGAQEKYENALAAELRILLRDLNF